MILIMTLLLGAFFAGFYTGYYRADVKFSDEKQQVTDTFLSVTKPQPRPEIQPESTETKTTRPAITKPGPAPKKPARSTAVRPAVKKAAAPVKNTIANVEAARNKPVDGLPAQKPAQKKAAVKAQAVTPALETGGNETSNKPQVSNVVAPVSVEQVNDEREATLLQDTTDSAEELNEVIPQQPAVEHSDTVDKQSAWYSIQVGVYTSLDNAVRVVNELERSKFEGYLLDEVNSKQEPRYNVRFGYYKSRNTALAALEKYKLQMSGSGYIVQLQQ